MVSSMVNVGQADFEGSEGTAVILKRRAPSISAVKA